MTKHWLFLLPFLLAACTHTAPPAPPTPAPAATPPAFVAAAAEAALPQLVAAEREAAHQRDLALLAQLWAPQARIVDGRSTAETGDDFIWNGRDAILDRYRVAVFPSPPPEFEGPPKLTIAVDGDRAEATLGQDRWIFVWQEGRWWAVELAYSMAGGE